MDSCPSCGADLWRGLTHVETCTCCDAERHSCACCGLVVRDCFCDDQQEEIERPTNTQDVDAEEVLDDLLKSLESPCNSGD
jgi:hypothetical protein